MMRIGRRTALKNMFLVGLASGSVVRSAPLFGAGRVSYPKSTMRLSRRIVRELHDGKAIIVSRLWHIQFEPQGSGLSIKGHQRSVSVDAPEKLAPLIEIEKRRSTDEMWPILISEGGMILAAGTETHASDIDAAIQAAEQILAQRGDNAEQRNHHRRYMAQLQQAGTSLLERLPPDLFFPVGRTSETARSIQLPDGSMGEFAVSYETEIADGGGWMSRAKREVTTRVSGDERRSIEVWEMGPVSG